MRRPSGEAGVAAPLVLALASVLALAGLVLASLAAVAVARQRAASAADLSAIAAAQSALDGEGPACARAGALARRVDATLLSCRLAGDVAVVVAAVRPPGPLGRLGTATAQARAGPGGRLALVRGRKAAEGRLQGGPPGVTSSYRLSLHVVSGSAAPRCRPATHPEHWSLSACSRRSRPRPSRTAPAPSAPCSVTRCAVPVADGPCPCCRWCSSSPAS